MGAEGAWAWLPVLPEGLIIIKPHGAAAAVALEPGSPCGVLEQHRGCFWKKSQDDEITICPPIWSVDLSKDTTLVCWGGQGVGVGGCEGLAWGVGTLNPTVCISPSPQATPADTLFFFLLLFAACGIFVP